MSPRCPRRRHNSRKEGSMHTILITLVLALLPLAVAAATGLLAKGAQYALHATAGLKNQQLRDSLDWAITTAEALADDVVVAVNQTVVNRLKATGTWDAAAATAAKTAALNALEAQLPTAARADPGAGGPAGLPGYPDRGGGGDRAEQNRRVPGDHPRVVSDGPCRDRSGPPVRRRGGLFSILRAERSPSRSRPPAPAAAGEAPPPRSPVAAYVARTRRAASVRRSPGRDILPVGPDLSMA